LFSNRLTRGLNTITDISSFLGIKEVVVRAGLTNLLQSEDVLVKKSSPKDIFRLSSKGVCTLRDAEIVTPEEHTIQIYFDALLRKPAAYHKDPFYSAKEIRHYNLLEIPFWPPTKPQVTDLSSQDVSKVIQQAARVKDNRVELLAIKAIERCGRLGRYAIALIYKSKRDDEINIAFAIDGRLSDELENAFALQEGPKRISIRQHLRDEGTERLLRELSKEIINEIPSTEAIEALEEKEAKAQAALDSASLEMDWATGEDAREKARSHITEALNRLGEAQASLEQIPIRYLSAYDHPQLLDKALNECIERLVITSQGLSIQVADANFVKQLEIILNRGVKVYIAYNLPKHQKTVKENENQKAEERIRKLVSRHQNLHLTIDKNININVLLADRKYVILSNFNWLSYRGDIENPICQGQGLLISKPEVVDAQFSKILKRLETLNA
jgi:hypothetical protein